MYGTNLCSVNFSSSWPIILCFHIYPYMYVCTYYRVVSGILFQYSAVWSESSVDAIWIAKNAMFLYGTKKTLDQTAWMRVDMSFRWTHISEGKEPVSIRPVWWPLQIFFLLLQLIHYTSADMLRSISQISNMFFNHSHDERWWGNSIWVRGLWLKRYYILLRCLIENKLFYQGDL